MLPWPLLSLVLRVARIARLYGGKYRPAQLVPGARRTAEVPNFREAIKSSRPDAAPVIGFRDNSGDRAFAPADNDAPAENAPAWKDGTDEQYAGVLPFSPSAAGGRGGEGAGLQGSRPPSIDGDEYCDSII